LVVKLEILQGVVVWHYLLHLHHWVEKGHT
jgi:hypothetical protein